MTSIFKALNNTLKVTVRHVYRRAFQSNRLEEPSGLLSDLYFPAKKLHCDICGNAFPCLESHQICQ